MNKDDDVKRAINSSVVHLLERMKYLDAENRYHILLEYGEWIFNEFDMEDNMVIPQHLLRGHEGSGMSDNIS